MSETLQMETRLRNISHKDVYIWEWDMCWNPARELSMQITASDGMEKMSKVLFCWIVYHRRHAKETHTNLSGSRQRRSTDPFTDFQVSDLVKKPGEYDVVAAFSSFLSADFIAKDCASDPSQQTAALDDGLPTITSQRIHVTVNP